MSHSRLRSPTREWLLVIAFGIFAYAFHYFGNDTGMYTRYWWFQIAAHYVSASALALLIARVGLSARLRGPRLAAFVVVVTSVGALGWEAVEYLGLFENLHFWGFADSALDLVADAAGIATVLFLLRTRLRPVIDPTVETPPLSELVGGSE